MSVLVDTGVLVAAAVDGDQRHARAAVLLTSIADMTPFITDHVLIEAWHLIKAREGRFHAMRLWFGLRESPLRIEAITLPDLERARAIAEVWPDQRFSIVDCTSFAVMERLGCRRVATFDSDFAIYRYGLDRAKAFDVLS